jgi:hypothetical protein
MADGLPVIETPTEHWGQALIRLMDTLDLSDWEALKIDDPVEWVKTLRREDESRLDPYWNGSW